VHTKRRGKKNTHTLTITVELEETFTGGDLLCSNRNFWEHGHWQLEQDLTTSVQLILALSDIETFAESTQSINGLLRFDIALTALVNPLITESLHVSLEVTHIFQQPSLESSLHVSHILRAVLCMVG
jgi:hypothetical protein